MSLCPVCGRCYCDHTLEERGQTQAEMDRPLSPEESAAFNENDFDRKLAAAKKHAHDPVLVQKFVNRIGPVGAKR